MVFQLILQTKLLFKEIFFIYSGVETNGLYVITPSTSNKHDIELNNSVVTIPSRRKEPFANLIRLWHIRLGHININRINRLVKDGILDNMVLEPMQSMNLV